MVDDSRPSASPLTVRQGALYISYMTLGRHLPRSYFKAGGNVSKRIRQLLLRPVLLQCGTNVNIESGAYIHAPHLVRVGSNSGIGVDCALDGPIDIGSDVMMGPECRLIAMNHDIGIHQGTMRQSGHLPAERIIEDDVWLGAGVIVLPGIRIGAGAVVGAGSVVTTNVAPGSTVAGNPAREIGTR